MDRQRMPIAELPLPTRLLAGGGPSTPDPRVLRALTTPLIGQFDPEFTAIMDDVVQLARATFLTSSPHCFAVSALPSGGLEAVLNSVLDGDTVSIGGSAEFVRSTADLVRRCGGRAVAMDARPSYVVVPHVDPWSGTRVDLEGLRGHAREQDARLIIDATHGLGACELRVDDWGIDVCVAGADYGLGAPSGMSLVMYTPEIDAHMHQRAQPPRTSYLDLLQLQAYWSPERLNHHTAPTSLVYGLREALRLVQLETLEVRWQRHADTGRLLHEGLRALGLDPRGDAPYAFVHLPTFVDEERAWQRMLEEFGVYVARLRPGVWRLGLLGADARPDTVHQLLHAVDKVLASA
jgi:aspartate aminotransferase-like enzyme